MTSPSPTSVLDVELRPGSPPVLQAGSPGDPAAWAGEHRGALRTAVLEHGSLLVRGLGLADADTAAQLYELYVREVKVYRPNAEPLLSHLRGNVELLVGIGAIPAPGPNPGDHLDLSALHEAQAGLGLR